MKAFYRKIFLVILLVIVVILVSGGSYHRAYAQTTLRGLASTRNFIIGTTANPNLLLTNTSYAAIVKNEFNQVTPGNAMKMDALQPTEGTFTYDEADSLVDFANTNNMKVHGHVFIWHQQYPGWLNTKTKDRATFLPIMENHIKNVAQHFGTNVWSWDVVNEAIEDNGTLRNTIWRQSIGDDYIDQAFLFARQYTPPGTKLIYNDYNVETINVKSNYMYNMVQGMLSRGIPIDAVGLQMHTHIWDAPSYEEVRSNIARFVALGIEVHISEMDVALGTTFPDLPTAEQLQQQKQIYADITKACLDTPGCTVLTIWGVSDGDSWLNSFLRDYEHPVLFDRNYAKKPAYFGVSEMLEGITPTNTPIPPTNTLAPATGAVRIDSGATQDYTDTFGNQWLADTAYVVGSAYSQTINVTADDDPHIYQTSRENLSDYNIPVANGTYSVRLHFAETNPNRFGNISGAGQRVFGVNVEGTTLNNFDIFAETGGLNTAVVKVFNVSVSDGVLNIHFSPVAGAPLIEGIEVLPGSPLPTSTNRPTYTPTFTPTPLPAGSNLLLNPGFENSINNWYCLGGSCSVLPATNPVHSGLGAGFVTSRSATWNGPTQNISSLGLMVNGGFYNTSIWVRSTSATPSVRMTIKVTDSNGDHYTGSGNFTQVNSGGWTQLTGTVQLSWIGTLSLAAMFIETNETAAPFVDLYVDDAFFAVSAVTPTPPPTPVSSTNLLSDGGTEQGLTYWYCFACTPLAVSSPVHGGSGAIQVTSRTASWNGPATNISATSLVHFVQGGSYTASVWARSAAGAPSAHINLKITDDTGDHYIGLTGFSALNSSDWTLLSGSNIVTWTGTLTAATLYVETNESASPFVDFYVDDASLEVAGSITNTPTPSPTPVSGTNLLNDGGVEQGLTFWYCFACTPLAVSSPVHGGSSAIQVTGRTASWNGPATNISATNLAKFTQGGTYSGSAWVRAVSGTPSAHITLKITDSAGDHFIGLSGFSALNNTDWTLISGSNTVTWTGTLAGAVFYVETNESAAPFVDFYVDDALLSVSGSVTQTPIPTATLTPTPSTTNTATSTPTNTPTLTVTPVPTETLTPTDLPTNTATSTYTPIVPTNTATVTVTAIKTATPTNVPGKIRPKLTVEALCSANPNLFDVWRVQNRTEHSVTFKWIIIGTSLNGLTTVTTNSKLTFQTPGSPNISIIQLWVNGEFHASAINLGVTCK